MNSLTTSPVTSVLENLFREADAVDRPLRERYGHLNAAEREALLKQRVQQEGDYKSFYAKLDKNFLSIDPALGRGGPFSPRSYRH